MNTKIGWVFYITIRKREWFKKFWKTRGANFMEIQIYNYCISLGLPWLKLVVDKAETNYPLKGINHFIETNETFNKWYHFRIGNQKINFKYCKSEIEMGKKCKEQCDHCKKYYAPLEKTIT